MVGQADCWPHGDPICCVGGLAPTGDGKAGHTKSKASGAYASIKMAFTAAHPDHHRLASLAVPWPVFLTAGLMVAVLLALSGAYGFHGDEMYYIVAGRHPALGYVDQPPLTPILSAASVALFGLSPTAVRILPALEMGFIVVLIALIVRDLGGTRRAQVLAAITAALSGTSKPAISIPLRSRTCSPGRSSYGCS